MSHNDDLTIDFEVVKQEFFAAVLKNDIDYVTAKLEELSEHIEKFNEFRVEIPNARSWDDPTATKTVTADVLTYLLHVPQLSNYSVSNDNAASYTVWKKLFTDFNEYYDECYEKDAQINLFFNAYATFGKRIMDHFDEYSRKSMLEHILDEENQTRYTHFATIAKETQLYTDTNPIYYCIDNNKERFAIFIAELASSCDASKLLQYTDNHTWNNLVAMAIKAKMTELAIVLAENGVSLVNKNRYDQTAIQLAEEENLPELKLKLEQINEGQKFAYLTAFLTKKFDAVLSKLSSLEQRVAAIETKLK